MIEFLREVTKAEDFPLADLLAVATELFIYRLAHFRTLSLCDLIQVYRWYYSEGKTVQEIVDLFPSGISYQTVYSAVQGSNLSEYHSILKDHFSSSMVSSSDSSSSDSSDY